MSVLTQGTHIFVVDPNADGGPAVVRIRKATNINPGDSPADQIEDTDLEELNTRTYKRGLRTPGQGTITVHADPQEPSHILLHEMASAGEDINTDFVIGWSDGTDLPTIEEGELVLPTTRTWTRFRGYVSDFPFDFQANALVATQATIQRSGEMTWKKKEVPAE